MKVIKLTDREFDQLSDYLRDLFYELKDKEYVGSPFTKRKIEVELFRQKLIRGVTNIEG